MPNCGTVTVTTSGSEINFGSTDNPNFRSRVLFLSNLGIGGVQLDISTTGGITSGYPLGDGEQLSLTGLNGIRGFSVIASTAAGSVNIAYLGSR